MFLDLVEVCINWECVGSEMGVNGVFVLFLCRFVVSCMEYSAGAGKPNDLAVFS